MKSLLSLLTLVLTAATAAAQPPRVWSRPMPPPREVLERLNLVEGWHTYVPVESTRDGLYTVQLTDREMLVQTRAGLIISLDPETGRTRWRSMPGQPYRDKHPLGYNSRLVFAGNGTHLYCFDRDTGAQLWSYDLPSAPVAAPVADEEMLFVPIGGARMQAYLLSANPPPPPPNAKRPPADTGTAPRASAPTAAGVPPARPPEEPLAPLREGRDYLGPINAQKFAGPGALEPPPITLVYDQLLANALDLAPLLTPQFMMMSDTHGILIGMSKYQQRELFRFPTGGPVSAPFAQLGDTAYVVSQDQNLYALSLITGRQLWRFTTPTIAYTKPVVTDASVYLSPSGSGLYRLDRDSGQLVWRNATAQRFLAANPKFIYANDRSDRLVILDRARGTLLSGYDTHDYVVPISNDRTDRIYLAANDGLVLCLHDREYTAPVLVRQPMALPPTGPRAAPPPRPAAKPPAEKPKEPAEKPKEPADKGNPPADKEK